ncbi:hypothetical protein WJX84_001687 [Apatococcus fuscideae]|uniref:GYF domain-containing protein n=1 Tax=Apatococcus fuscideae TaxID=2026836 RepID=A0AAW1T272_9CHLO
MAHQQSSVATVEASLASGQAAEGPSAASHHAPAGALQHHVHQPVDLPSLSISGPSPPSPSAAASVIHGTVHPEPHPHQDCLSAIADGPPAWPCPTGRHGAARGGLGKGRPTHGTGQGGGSDGAEHWAPGPAEPGFSSTAPLLTAAADAGHSCTAAPSGSEASQQPRGPEQGMSGPGRGLPPDPQASEGTVTPALSGGDPQIEASSGELSGDEEGALPDASSPLRPSPRPEASIPVLWDLPHHEGTSKVHSERSKARRGSMSQEGRSHGRSSGSSSHRRHASSTPHRAPALGEAEAAHGDSGREGGRRRSGGSSHRSHEHRSKRRRPSGHDESLLRSPGMLSEASLRPSSPMETAPAHAFAGTPKRRSRDILSPDMGGRRPRWPGHEDSHSHRSGGSMLTPPHGIHSSGGPSWGMPPPSLPSFSERRGASFPGSSPLRPVRGAGRMPGHSGCSGRSPPRGHFVDDWAPGSGRRQMAHEQGPFNLTGPHPPRRPPGTRDRPQAWTPHHPDPSSHHPPSRFMPGRGHRDEHLGGSYEDPSWMSPPRGRGKVREDPPRGISPPMQSPSPPRMGRAMLNEPGRGRSPRPQSSKYGATGLHEQLSGSTGIPIPAGDVRHEGDLPGPPPLLRPVAAEVSPGKQVPQQLPQQLLQEATGPAKLAGTLSDPPARAPSPLSSAGEVLADVGLVQHTNACWFYTDPEGHPQGPCSIAHFHAWLLELSRLPVLAREYKEFQAVGAQTSSDRATIRKLEARLTATSSLADLQSRCADYKHKAERQGADISTQLRSAQQEATSLVAAKRQAEATIASLTKELQEARGRVRDMQQAVQESRAQELRCRDAADAAAQRERAALQRCELMAEEHDQLNSQMDLNLQQASRHEHQSYSEKLRRENEGLKESKQRMQEDKADVQRLHHAAEVRGRELEDQECKVVREDLERAEARASEARAAAGPLSTENAHLRRLNEALADSKALLQANLDSERASPATRRHELSRKSEWQQRSASPSPTRMIPASWDTPLPAAPRYSVSPRASPQQPMTPEPCRPKSVKEASNEFFEAALKRPKPAATSRSLHFPSASTSGHAMKGTGVLADPGPQQQWDQGFLDGMSDLIGRQSRESLPPCMQGALDCMHSRSLKAAQ